SGPTPSHPVDSEEHESDGEWVESDYEVLEVPVQKKKRKSIVYKKRKQDALTRAKNAPPRRPRKVRKRSRAFAEI
ncbi:hypothetical protein GOP47_0030590, partial [Adiantum capillus-veneris]